MQWLPRTRADFTVKTAGQALSFPERLSPFPFVVQGGRSAYLHL